ncbi:hypothetical protein KKB18_11325, partial [bacterium]|nr:hypothetical protein [bacterium]
MKKVEFFNATRYLILLMALSLLASPSRAGTISLDKGIEDMADDLVDGIVHSQKTRVGVVAFTTVSQQKSDFGNLVAEKLNTEIGIKGKNKITLKERSQVDKLIGEDPNLTAEKASKLLEIDILVTGTYALRKDKVDINAKAILCGSSTLGQNISTAKCLIDAKDCISLLCPKKTGNIAEKDMEKQELTLSYQILASKSVDGRMCDVLVRKGDTLNSGDKFSINLRTSDDCYLYVLLFSSQGE